MAMLAGSTLVGVAHEHLPLMYMIVDIKQGRLCLKVLKDQVRCATTSPKSP